MCKYGVEAAKVIFDAVKKSHFNRIAEKVALTQARPGHCRCEVVVDESHANAFGTLHGGWTASMADIVTTVALLNTERGAPGVSVDLNVSYMSAARVGEKVVMDADVIKAGKRLAFTKFEIRRASDDTIVAQARHTKAFA